jgi:hypothetical protein
MVVRLIGNQITNSNQGDRAHLIAINSGCGKPVAVIVVLRVSKRFTEMCPAISNDSHHLNNMIQDTHQMGAAYSRENLAEESIEFINTDFILIYPKIKVGLADVKLEPIDLY